MPDKLVRLYQVEPEGKGPKIVQKTDWIPDFLLKTDWSVFSKQDIDDIVEFIRFKQFKNLLLKFFSPK